MSLRSRRKVILRQPLPLPDALRTDTGEPTTGNILDAIQLLWCQGRTNRECQRILNLSSAKWYELMQLLKTVNTTPQNAQQAFETFAWEYEKFKLRVEHQLTQLDELLTHCMKIDPLWGGPYDVRAASKIILSQTKLVDRLRSAAIELLAIKVRLGLVVIPEARQLPVPLNGDDPVFTGATIKAAWAQRTLLNGPLNGSQSRN
jgi:hypothetical protein